MTTVIVADPTAFRAVATNTIDESCDATPAIAGGRIYLRTGKNLYCIGAETQ